MTELMIACFLVIVVYGILLWDAHVWYKRWHLEMMARSGMKLALQREMQVSSELRIKRRDLEGRLEQMAYEVKRLSQDLYVSGTEVNRLLKARNEVGAALALANKQLANANDTIEALTLEKSHCIGYTYPNDRACNA